MTGWPEGIDPDGVNRIVDWVKTVFADNNHLRLWTALDDRLRLTLAQGWILQALRSQDDDLAEDLADEETDNAVFPDMLDHLVKRWRSVYVALKDGIGVWDHTILVGADMELFVLTGPEYFGEYQAGAAIPGHCFIIRFENDEWKIAALARRLPVPGWPPSEQSIANLEISAASSSD